MSEYSLPKYGVLIALVFIVGSAVAAPTMANTSHQLDGSGTAEDPYVITTAEELQAIEENLEAHYVLGNDVDASETADWNAGAGFEPIGEENDEFAGVFDGQNHTIEGLTIRQPQAREIGLFAYSEGTIKNVHLHEATVSGERVVGTVVGENYGELTGVSVTGEVTSQEEAKVGGLVGWDRGGSISKSWTDVDVSNAALQTGGLVGDSQGQISDSYARGDVEGNRVGGVVGDNGGSAQRLYATGRITVVDVGSKPVSGGLVGENGLLVDSYWDVETSGQSEPVGDGNVQGTGLTTDQMTGTAAATHMDGFDFQETWALTDEYPILQWEIRDLSLGTVDEIVVAGEQTDASVRLDRIADRSVGAASVADLSTDDESVATAQDGVVTGRAPGEVTVTANHAGFEDTTTVLVIAAEGISAIGAEVDGGEVTTGNTVSVTGTFRNVDENATFHHADLTVDGEAVATENVTVDGDSDTTHTFEWTPEETGTYELAVDGITAGSVEVNEQADQSGGDGAGDGDGSGDGGDTGGSTEGGSSDLSPVLVVVAILAAAALGTLARRRE